MTDKWLYEVFKILISNFSLVLFVVLGALRFFKAIEKKLASLGEMEANLKCITHSFEAHRRQMSEFREELRRALKEVPKRKED